MKVGLLVILTLTITNKLVEPSPTSPNYNPIPQLILRTNLAANLKRMSCYRQIRAQSARTRDIDILSVRTAG